MLERVKEGFQKYVLRWMRGKIVSKRYRRKQMQRMVRKGNRDLSVHGNSMNVKKKGRVGLNALKV